MKKTVVSIIACLMLLLTLSVSAFADSPWTDSSMKVYLATSFDAYENGEIKLNEEPFWVGDQVPPQKAKWENGRLVFFESDGTALSFRIADTEFNSRGSQEYQIKAKGMGFYVENNSQEDVTLDLFMPGFSDKGNACYGFSADTEVELISVDGEAIAGELGSDNSVYIPAGFKGYVNFDLETLQNAWGGGTPWAPESVPITLVGFTFRYLYLEEGETFVIDNLYLYGTDIPQDNSAFEVVPVATKAPTQAPTQTASSPTAEPANTSAQPQNTTKAAAETEGEKSGGSDGIFSLTLIIILAAGAVVVAAIIVIATIMARKKSQKSSNGENEGNQADKKE